VETLRGEPLPITRQWRTPEGPVARYPILPSNIDESRYILAGMESHDETPPIVILPISDGKWSATAQTPDGPLTAIGDSIEDAKVSLDGLLVIAHAVEAARRQIEALTRR